MAATGVCRRTIRFGGHFRTKIKEPSVASPVHQPTPTNADQHKSAAIARYWKLKIRDFPKDGNPNYRETRQIVGSHFG